MAAPDFLFTISARLDGAVASNFAQFEKQGVASAARVTSGINQINRSVSTTATRLQVAASAAGAFQGALGGVSSRLNSAALLFRGAGVGFAATISALAGGAALLGATANIQNYQARLKAATNDQAEFTSSYQLLQRAATDTRSGLNDTIAFYVRLKAGTEQLGLSQKTLGTIVSTVQKSIQLSGAGAQEAAVAMTQFVQGLSSANGLSGDEFKTLGESAVKVLQNIAAGIQKANAIPGFDGTISSLRKLGTQGKLTADVLVPAIEAISGKVDSDFSRMPVTIGQATTLMKNSLASLVISVENATGILSGSAKGIQFLSENLRAIGGVAVVAGTALTAGFAAPLLLTAGRAALAAVQFVALVSGLNGAGPAFLAGALGATRFRAAMTALLTPTNLITGALTLAAGALYYFQTQETLAEAAARRLGISQDELRAKAFGVKDAINSTNVALREQSRLSAAQDLNDQKNDALSARSRVVGALKVARSSTIPGDDRAKIEALIDRYSSLKLNASQLTAEVKKLGLSAGVYNRVVTAAAQSTIAATAVVELKKQAAGLDTVTVATRKTAAATGDLTKTQLAANAAVRAISASTDPLVAARRKSAKELADLDANYKKLGKSPTAEQQAIYEAQRAGIVSALDQQIAAIKDGEAAKIAARRAGNAENRAVAREAVRDINAELAATKAAISQFEQISSRYQQQPTRQKAAERDRNDALFAFLNGGTDKAGFDKFSEDQAAFLVKPISDANERAREQLDLQRLILAGREADAEVLTRAVELLHQGVDVQQINLRNIASQVDAELDINRAIEQRNQLIELGARAAGDVQNSVRDFVRGLSDGKIGASTKNLFSSLQDSFKDNFADEISLKLFGGSAEENYRRNQLGALKTNSDRLSDLAAALADYQRALETGAAGGGISSAAASSPVGDFTKSLDGFTSLLASAGSSPLAANDNAGGSGIVSSFAGGGKSLTGLVLGNLAASANTFKGASVIQQGVAKKQDILFGQSGTAQRYNDIGKQLGEGFDKLFNTDFAAGLGSRLGDALQGASTGSAVSALAGSFGLKQSKTGAALGGAAGAFIPGLPPGVGAAIGGLIAGTIGGLFKKVKYGAVTIGGAEAGAAFGNSAGAKKTAKQAGDSVANSLASLAAQFNATLGTFQAITLGVRDKNFRVNLNGTSLKKSKGAVDFGDDSAAALEFAIKQAIGRGALEGLREGTKRLLSAAGDLNANAVKAGKFENVFKDLKRLLDPVGAASDEVNAKFTDLRRIFEQAGASAEEYGQLQQLYDLQRADSLKQAQASIVGTLKSYLVDLTTNETTGLSIRDRESAAAANFQPFADAINAGKTVNQDDFRAAADRLLQSDRELFGSTQPYFERLTQITDLTRKAIADQSNVTSIAAALDLRNSATVAPITTGLTALQTALINQGAQANSVLVGILNAVRSAPSPAYSGGGGTLSFGRVAQF